MIKMYIFGKIKGEIVEGKPGWLFWFREEGGL